MNNIILAHANNMDRQMRSTEGEKNKMDKNLILILFSGTSDKPIKKYLLDNKLEYLCRLKVDSRTGHTYFKNVFSLDSKLYELHSI